MECKINLVWPNCGSLPIMMKDGTMVYLKPFLQAHYS